ncbi:hypothetical protein [Stieleria varia]|uniref:Quinol:cytochrome C oxidoreductase n=1 Tax=Stieleria varia TaxID=2528005 RepID=A0A5C6AZ53_9BACT|nr:hypothetical protein [Stieleria varia]TWU04960.1 hypothetical protein Pla52n_30050 [Stieleria varia]
MSEHAAVTVKPADDPAFKLPERLAGLAIPLCIGGLVLLVIGMAVAMMAQTDDTMPRFGYSAYLTAFLYCLTIAMGGMFFVLIQHLARAGWSVVVRRIAEFLMFMVIPLAFLFVPILVGVYWGGLYAWTSETFGQDAGVAESVWKAKSSYLNAGWFTLRAVVYFTIWIGLALYFWKGSVGQDETGERAATDRMQYWSGPATMAFALSLSFAAFDWGMSLAPMWFSTMFGVYIFAGGILSAHCAIALGAYVLQRSGAIKDEVTVEHYHDLGKYIFGFVFFWTYISFSQYLLIWYGNIPEETEWFYSRQHGGFGYLSIALIVFHWIIPFLGTMSRHVRRNPNLVAFWAAYILIVHFIDIYWIVMPEARALFIDGEVVHTVPTFGGAVGVIGSLMCVVGMVGLIIGLILKLASSTRVIAARDPRLAESIGFENI